MHTNLVDSFASATGEELIQQHIEYHRRSGMLLRTSAEDVAHGGITTWPPI
jgi:hypothetical protein